MSIACNNSQSRRTCRSITTPQIDVFENQQDGTAQTMSLMNHSAQQFGTGPSFDINALMADLPVPGGPHSVEQVMTITHRPNTEIDFCPD